MTHSNFLSIVALVLFSTSFIAAADGSIKDLQQKIRNVDQLLAQTQSEDLSFENLTKELLIRAQNIDQAQDPEGMLKAHIEGLATSFMATAVSSLYLAKELAHAKLENAQLKQVLKAAGAADAPLSESKALILHPANQKIAAAQSSIITSRSPALLMPPVPFIQPIQSTPKRNRWSARLCGARFAHDKED